MTTALPLLAYCATVFGIAWGIGHSHASYPIRRALKNAGFTWTVTLLECVGCSSYHLGWIAYAAGLAPVPFTRWWSTAFATATASLLLFHATGLDAD